MSQNPDLTQHMVRGELCELCAASQVWGGGIMNQLKVHSDN